MNEAKGLPETAPGNERSGQERAEANIAGSEVVR